MSTKHTVEFTHEIDGGPHDGLEIAVTAEFVREGAEFLGEDHPANAYNAGWYLERLYVQTTVNGLADFLSGWMANPILDDELEDILKVRATQLFERRP